MYSIQSDPSESDLSSYSLNYESDIINDENDPILLYPTIPLANYSQDRDDPEDQANWIKLEEDDIWSVPPLPLLRPGGLLNMFFTGWQPEDFLMPYLMKQCGQI